MANLFADLPMPVANGPGAAVDVSGMGRDKTVVVRGDFPGATITIEISQDAGGATGFAPVTTFQNGDQRRLLEVAARYMRVNVEGRKGAVTFTANADVGASDIGAQFAALPMPAGNGVGAAVDVSALGSYCTFITAGSFLGVTLTIEASEDGVAYAPVVAFANYGGQQSAVVTANFMRVRVSGRKAVIPFTATAAVGAVNDASGGGGGGGTPGISNCLIYQPGGGSAGPGTFDTWSDLITALGLLRADASGGGCYTIQFDDQFVSPAVVPAGAYNMTDVTWEGRADGFGAFVELAEGSSFAGLRRFEGYLQVTNLNTTAPAVIDLLNGGIVTLHGAVLETVTGGQPFFGLAALGPGDTVVFELYETSQIGASPLVAGPVIDAPAGATVFIGTEGASAIAVPGAVVGAVGATLQRASSSLATVNTVYPNWLGTIDPPRLDVAPSLVPTPYLLAPAVAPVSATFNLWMRLDASGGAIAQPLPAIGAAAQGLSGPGCFVLVSEHGGGVATVTPNGADTIGGAAGAVRVPANGALLLVSDGVSDWTVVAIVGGGPTNWQSFTYTATGVEGQAFTVTLPVAQPDATYQVRYMLGVVVRQFGIAVASKIAASFDVETTTAPMLGDVITFDVFNGP